MIGYYGSLSIDGDIIKEGGKGKGTITSINGAFLFNLILSEMIEQDFILLRFFFLEVCNVLLEFAIVYRIIVYILMLLCALF